MAPSARSSSLRRYGAALIPPRLAGLLLLVALLGLVEVAVASGVISRTIVARPSEAFLRLFHPENRAELLDGFLTTFSMTAVAMALEAAVAVPLGLFLFRRRDFGIAYSSWLTALFAAPIFLLYPLFLVIFGRNAVTLVIMGFLPGVIPLIIQVERGLAGVSRTLVNVGQSVGATPFQIFWKIMLPAAAPSVFSGFRLALIYTLINIIAIEYLVDIGGLGRIVADRYFRFDVVGTYAAIIGVAAINIVFNSMIGTLERWVRPR